jgi:hypothetical protein
MSLTQNGWPAALVPRALEITTNNKLGLVKRMGAYGFVNADNFAARGLILCPGAGP